MYIFVIFFLFFLGGDGWVGLNVLLILCVWVFEGMYV